MEVAELHAKIVELFEKLLALKDLIDYESNDLRDVISKIVSKELIYFTSMD